MIDKNQLKNKSIEELEEMRTKFFEAYVTQKDSYQVEMLEEVGKVLKLKKQVIKKEDK